MEHFYSQLRLAIWKIFLYRKRHWIQTTADIFFVSVLVFSILHFRGQNNGSSKYTNRHIEPMAHLTNFQYEPRTNLTDILANTIVSRTKKGGSSELSLININVLFDDNLNETSPKVHYTMKMGTTNRKFYRTSSAMIADSLESLFDKAFEVSSLFVALELDWAILDRFGVKSAKKLFRLSFEKMQLPPDVSKLDNSSDYYLLAFVYRIMVAFSVLGLCLITAVNIAEERKSGILELQKLMGQSLLPILFAWILYIFAISIVLASILTAAFKLTIMPYFWTEIIEITAASPAVFFVAVLLFVVANVTFVVFLFTLIDSIMLATSLAAIGSLVIISYNADFSTSFDYLLVFFPASHLGMVFKIITSHSLTGQVVDATKLFSVISVDSDDVVSMFQCYVSLIIVTWVYSISIIYLWDTRKKTFGVSKKWYFPLTALWESIAIRMTETQPEIDADRRFDIEVKNLTKTFDGLNALDDLSLNVTKNRRTVLLGHNGSGKSTLMKIMTGMIAPTSGDIRIKGFSVVDQIKKVQEFIGFCPQDNVNCSYMTIREHLVYFAMLRNVKSKVAEEEADQYMMRLSLSTKADSRPDELSGGMKRKLQIAIALIANRPILIFDEPSSGLDPQSRHEVWNVLMEIGEKRTILLSTHFMEEAETLSDKIAILKSGKLIDYGSIDELKSKYYSGYQLRVRTEIKYKSKILGLIRTVFDKVDSLADETICDHDQNQNRDANAHLLFNISNRNNKKLQEMFRLLEANEKKYAIHDLELTLLSLEDVFLKTASKSTNLKLEKRINDIVGSNEVVNEKKLKGRQLHLRHFKLLFQKKFLYVYRNVRSFMENASFPLLVVFALCQYGSAADRGSGGNLSSSSLTGSFKLSDEELYPNANKRYFLEYDRSDPVLQNHASFLNESFNGRLFYTENITRSIFERSKTFDSFLQQMVAFRIENMIDTTEIKTILNPYYKFAPLIAVEKIFAFMISSSTNRSSPLEIQSSLLTHNSNFMGKLLDESSPLFLWPMLIFGLFFFSSYGMMFAIDESHELKHLQYICGISPLKYWLTNYLFDFFIYNCFVAALFLILNKFENNQLLRDDVNYLKLISKFVTFVTRNHHPDFLNTYLILGFIYCIVVEYGSIAILFSYTLAIIFKSKFKCYLYFILVTLASFGFSIQQAFYRGKKEESNNLFFLLNLGEFFTNVFHLMHTKVMRTVVPGSRLATVPAHYFKNYKSRLVTNAANIIVFVLLICLVEMKIPSRLRSFLTCYGGGASANDDEIDADVHDEARRVDKYFETFKNGSGKHNLVVKNLTKIYRNWFAKNLYAVKNLSFHVKKGECFVLLGTNGAGKSTVFKILTNDIVRDSGEIFFGGSDPNDNLGTYLARLGYCSQKNILLDCMTGYELLKIFAQIRGISSDYIDTVVTNWIDIMELTNDAHKLSGHYSGGNKRRLCAAIAMVGNPEFTLLDEPTTGVDPVGRRRFWNAVSLVKKWKQSILLTSHSMDECEVLSDRISIMKNGRLMCIGTLDHLKNKFCYGFNVFLKLKSGTQSEKIVKMFTNAIENVQFIKKNDLTLHFVIEQSLKLSDAFELVESFVENHSGRIDDYFVNKMNLEQLFLKFAE